MSITDHPQQEIHTETGVFIENNVLIVTVYYVIIIMMFNNIHHGGGNMAFAKMPAYIRVYNTLRSRILDGDYAVGDLLPSEPELEKQYLVSRTTVRKAVEMLSREGLVETKQGRGTIVLDYHTTQNINQVSSLSETLEQKGHVVYCKNMYINTVPASARVANELQIKQGSPIILIQRL